MRATAFLLADFASDRGGLLNIIGGGVTVIGAMAYPIPLGVSVAAAIEFQPADFDKGHDVTITVRSDTGEVLGTVSGNLRSTMTPGADPTEPNAVTLAIDLRPLAVPRPGTYQVSLAVNGEELASAGFVARPAGPAPE